MGIYLHIQGQEEEIEITGHTLTELKMEYVPLEGNNTNVSGQITGVRLFGRLDVYDKGGEIIEVEKLSEWSKLVAHEEDAYRSIVIEFQDNSGNPVDTIEQEKSFLVSYEETRGSNNGEGTYTALIRFFDNVEEAVAR